MMASSPLKPCDCTFFRTATRACNPSASPSRIWARGFSSPREPSPHARSSCRPDAAGSISRLPRFRRRPSSFSRPTISWLQRVGEIAGFIQHVGNAAGHARGEIAAGLAQHHHAPAGHVFATVIADGLDDRVHAASCARQNARRPCRAQKPRRSSRRKAPRCR